MSFRISFCACVRGLYTNKPDSNVDVLAPSSISSISLPTATDPGGLAKVSLEDGQELLARLVVGADGAQSFVRNSAGIGRWEWDYEQRGVVTTVATSTKHSTAWQRFLKTGPVAILPVSAPCFHTQWQAIAAHVKSVVGSLFQYCVVLPSQHCQVLGEHDSRGTDGRPQPCLHPHPFMCPSRSRQ